MNFPEREVYNNNSVRKKSGKGGAIGQEAFSLSCDFLFYTSYVLQAEDSLNSPRKNHSTVRVLCSV